MANVMQTKFFIDAFASSVVNIYNMLLLQKR